MLQEQPKEKDAPQASGFNPWHTQVLLKREMHYLDKAH